jgi:hypothetical protein
VLCYQVQDIQYAIWGTSSKAISVDGSWHGVARISEAYGCRSLIACLQIFCKTFWVCFLSFKLNDIYVHEHTRTCMRACKHTILWSVYLKINNEVYAENFIHQQYLITNQVNVVILHIIKIVLFKMLEEHFIRATVDISYRSQSYAKNVYGFDFVWENHKK